jgi:hypothetical protein
VLDVDHKRRHILFACVTLLTMQVPNRRVLIASAGFVLFSFLAIASTMISAVRNHLRSKILPYLQAPFTSTSTSTSTIISPLSSNMSTLSAFLANNKQTFLADLTSKHGEGWTIVMGNEAGGKPLTPTPHPLPLLTRPRPRLVRKRDRILVPLYHARQRPDHRPHPNATRGPISAHREPPRI